MIVLVSYDIDGSMGTDPVIDAKLTEMAELMGGRDIGGGSGFGSRDLEFEFDNDSDALSFFAKCEDAGFDAYTYEDEEGEDDEEYDEPCDCEHCINDKKQAIIDEAKKRVEQWLQSGLTREELLKEFKSILGVDTALEADADERSQLAKILAKEEKALQQSGYYVHAVFGDANTPFGDNVHTHGLDMIGHKDLQIVAPMGVNDAHAYISQVAKLVVDGKKLSSGDKILLAEGQMVLDAGFKTNRLYVKLVDATESERAVLRIILPDPDGNLDLVDLSSPYADQYEGVVEGGKTLTFSDDSKDNLA